MAGAKVTSNETAIVASRRLLVMEFKVFGGIRLNQFKASIYLLEANTTQIININMNLDTGTSTGFTIGAAYEVPQIMLRASIQYNS